MPSATEPSHSQLSVNSGWKDSLPCSDFPEIFTLPTSYEASIIDDPKSAAVQLQSDILVSPNDKMKYRVIQLENGLVALLVSDLADGEVVNDDDDDDAVSASSSEEESDEEEEETESDEEDDDEETEKPHEGKKMGGEKLSAASLCVGMASFCDPDDIPGLSHFLEHMVFMGSEKYPDENAFDVFIQEHGGSDNAYTEWDRTVFHFDIQRRYFKEALDRFAQFFIKPLMKQDSVDREIQAVNSEFEMNLNSDYSRKEQLIGLHMRQDHPMAKFAWGNKESLDTLPKEKNIDLYARLQDYHNQAYSAHYMTLAVQSKATLDELESWVREIFSEISNNQLPRPNFGHLQDPFGSERFLKLYKVVPVKDQHQVEIVWALPSVLHHYRSKPLHYLGWLVGHEGKGSVLSYLKKRLWATAIYAGNSENNTEHNITWAMFGISVTLTDSGLENVNEVIKVIFQYLEMLRKSGPQERIFREIQTIEENDFRWQEESDPVDCVDRYSVNMQMYPVNHFLSGDKLLFDYNPKVIEECQRLLIPERSLILLLSKNFETDNICDQQERWFKTKYSVSDVPAEWIDSWQGLEPHPDLHLPQENAYIATDFSINTNSLEPSVFPVKLSDSSHGLLWYKKDTKFKVPKAYIYFHFITPYTYCNAYQTVHTDLYLRTLEQNLADVAYAAEAAQLTYSLRADEKGILLKVNGFNHKLTKLFCTIVDHMADFSASEDLLETMKDQLKRTYRNQCIKPNKLVKELRLAFIQQPYWPSWERLKAIDQVTAVSMGKYVAQLHKKLLVEGLVVGNMEAADITQLETYVIERLGCQALPAQYKPQVRVHELSPGAKYLRVKNMHEGDNNCVLTNYYQHGPASIREAVTNELVVMMMQEPCFNYLRTEKQLGYTVFCTNRHTAGILGLSVTVCSQSDNFCMKELNQHIEDFLVIFEEKLRNMPEDQFNTQVNALITLKKCEDNHLGEEADRYWTEVQLQNYVFDRLEKEVAVLESLTKEDAIAWFEAHTPVNQGKFRKISTQVVGCADKDKAENDRGNQPECLEPQFLPMDNDTEQAVVNLKAFQKGHRLYPESKILN